MATDLIPQPIPRPDGRFRPCPGCRGEATVSVACPCGGGSVNLTAAGQLIFTVGGTQLAVTPAPDEVRDAAVLIAAARILRGRVAPATALGSAGATDQAETLDTLAGLVLDGVFPA
jgi:hypothetical protein